MQKSGFLFPLCRSSRFCTMSVLRCTVPIVCRSFGPILTPSNTLAERLLDSEASRPLRPRANEDATLLSLEDLTEEEWSQRRTSYEVG